MQYAILAIIEKTESKEDVKFKEAIFWSQLLSDAGHIDSYLSKEAVLKMIPFGGRTDSKSIELTIINSFAEKGYRMVGTTGPFFPKKGEQEIRIYLEEP